MLKLEDHRKFTVIRIAVQFGIVRICAPGLAHRDHISLLECIGTHLTDIFVQMRSICCDLLIRLFCDLVNDIQAASSDAFFHPPVDHLIDFCTQFRIVPV